MGVFTKDDELNCLISLMPIDNLSFSYLDIKKALRFAELFRILEVAFNI